VTWQLSQAVVLAMWVAPFVVTVPVLIASAPPWQE
jgi:hypothetical protein